MFRVSPTRRSLLFTFYNGLKKINSQLHRYAKEDNKKWPKKQKINGGLLYLFLFIFLDNIFVLTPPPPPLRPRYLLKLSTFFVRSVKIFKNDSCDVNLKLLCGEHLHLHRFISMYVLYVNGSMVLQAIPSSLQIGHAFLKSH